MKKQVAALPYRFDDDGNVEVLLITSRGGQRWIPPKGNLINGLSPHRAAEREAYEEAGVVGCISDDPLGDYKAVKSLPNGAFNNLAVTLFPMHVEGRMTDWPERGQRAISWFEPKDAANVVKEPGLARMIRGLRAQLRRRLG